jgi:hypothetical protein
MFKNIKTWYDGFLYDSKGESQLAQDLDRLLRDRYITKIERQVPFTLYENGKRVCLHKPDFVVTRPNGKREVREFKGNYEGQAIDRWKNKLRLFTQNYPDIPYYTVKKDRHNIYRLYSAQDILGETKPQLIKQEHTKYPWYEIFFAYLLHKLAGFIF